MAGFFRRIGQKAREHYRRVDWGCVKSYVRRSFTGPKKLMAEFESNGDPQILRVLWTRDYKDVVRALLNKELRGKNQRLNTNHATEVYFKNRYGQSL